MKDRLIAKIEGKSVGFALATREPALKLERVWSGPTEDFSTFTDALQHYLTMNGLRASDHRHFAVAVAGVPRGDVISITNCRWFVSVSGLRSFLRCEPLVLNDYAATAWSLTALDRSRLVPIGGALPRPIAPGATFLVIGTGSGLGVATLHVTRAGEVVVIQSEGGHASFAPVTPAEEALLPFLRRRFGHVSYERLLSYPGLQNIYEALAARDGKGGGAPDPRAIVAAGLGESDPLAVETLKVFADALGSFAGSAALTVGAWDGVFLTRHMLRELGPAIAPRLRQQFAGKGRLSKTLQLVPVALVNQDDTSLLGAAAALFACERDAASVAAAPAVESGLSRFPSAAARACP